ncbi:MAG: efflux RND transporter periplasmic adaptor subunit [Armatimonadota bacterium]
MAILVVAIAPYMATRPRVEVVRPVRRDLVERVSEKGYLRAVMQLDLASEVPGTVRQVLVREGDKVRRGQPVVVLDLAEAQENMREAVARVQAAQIQLQLLEQGPKPADIEAAKAELSKAQSAGQAKLEAAREKVKKLEADGKTEEVAAAKSELQAIEQEQGRLIYAAQSRLQAMLNASPPGALAIARARLQEAEAAARLAQVQGMKRIIAAPISGTVTKRYVDPGCGVKPGEPLITVADMSRTEIVVDAAERDLPKLGIGQTATVVASAYKDESFQAVLMQIGSSVDRERGTIELKLKPKSVPKYVRPGLSMNVKIEVSRLSNALTVPTSSLVAMDGKSYVYVVEKNTVRRKSVVVYGAAAGYSAVDGLSEQAEVVVHGAGVKSRQRVRTVERLEKSVPKWRLQLPASSLQLPDRGQAPSGERP